ncbi:hypothetical protein [Archangium sp.]|uniref:hypothetical protein n=1 Tax=Archangium sp. TaxID=1872627 RepID=UPI00286B9334|nr:hypothetical protein [Archangium sp.]
MAPEAVVSKEPKKERMPRVDWAKLLRRTFALDVFTCAWCGGRGPERVSKDFVATSAP